MPWTADFEAGTVGNQISTLDPGSANAWDALSKGANTTITYANDQAHTGTKSAKIVSAASGGAYLTTLAWQSPTTGANMLTHYGRIYFRPAQNMKGDRVVQARGSAGAQLCSISVYTDNTIRLLNSALAIVGTGTRALANNLWNRIEWKMVHNSTTGIVEAKLFIGANADGTTPDETITATNVNTGTTALYELHFGLGDNDAALTMWLDDILGGATSYPGGTGGGSTPTVISRDTVTVHAGAGSLKVVTGGAHASEGAFSSLSTAGTITPGTAYKAQAWVNAPSGQAMKIGVEWHDSAGAFLSSAEQSFTGTGSWQQIQQNFTAPASASRALMFIYTGNVTAAITFYIDDASLQAVTGTTVVSISTAGIQGNSVILTLASTLNATDTVTADYTPGSAPITDIAGNQAAAFSNQSVAATSAPPPPPPPPSGGAQPVGVINNISGNGTSSGAASRTLAFFSGDTKDKWVREDNGNVILSWAHTNGLKVIGLFRATQSSSVPGGQPSAINCDATELDNEPYLHGVEPHSWAAQMRNDAIAIRNGSLGVAYHNQPILLPLVAHGHGMAAVDNAGNYTYNGVKKPWITWVNEGASDIWQYVDGFAIHPYFAFESPANLPTLLNTLRSQLTALGVPTTKLFWATEMGWTTNGGTTTWDVTEQQQSDYSVQFINLWRARSDTGPMLFYRLDDLNSYANAGGLDGEPYYGLNRYPAYDPKPAWTNIRAKF